VGAKAYTTPSKDVMKFHPKRFEYPANRQTNQLTNRDKSITLLAEVSIHLAYTQANSLQYAVQQSDINTNIRFYRYDCRESEMISDLHSIGFIRYIVCHSK